MIIFLQRRLFGLYVICQLKPSFLNDYADALEELGTLELLELDEAALYFPLLFLRLRSFLFRI